MRRTLTIAAVIVLAVGLGGAAPAPVTLAGFVQAMLSAAPSTFASLRGTKADSESYYVSYNLRPSAAGLCSGCRIYDNYARGTRIENWTIRKNFVRDPAGSGALIQASKSTFMMGGRTAEWPIQKTEAYVTSQLAPLFSSFSLQRTVSYGYPTLLWRGPRHVWVSAEIYPGTAYNLILRVGHDLTKNVHVLRPPSTAQLANLSSILGRNVKIGISAAIDNFSSLRGPANTKDDIGHTYFVKSSYQGFQRCELVDIATRSGASFDRTFTPAWAMNCRTPWMAGTLTALEDTAAAAVRNALPSSFAPVADAKSRGDDYRWDNGSGISVAIDSNEDDGVAMFLVRILRFLPKQ